MARETELGMTARGRRPWRGTGVVLAVISMALAAVPAARAQSIPEVFQKVRDSVVIIETVGKDVSTGSKELVDVGGLGSGVLVDSLGQVLTAAHVVQTAEVVRVHLRGGEVYEGKVLASAQAADLALVKLDRPPVGATVARLGDSDQVQVGEQIFIVGAPLGISYTLTVGHISARRAAKNLWGGFAGGELLQTDAAINHGNSGGPMFNLKGEVVGIVSSMISRSGGYEGLGFVISSNTARDLVLERKTPWTGMEGYLLGGEIARALNLPQDEGILVQRVAANSPAQRLGLVPGGLRAFVGDEELILGGDIILSVQGVAVSTADADRLRSMLQEVVPGETVKLTVLRAGKRVDLSGVLIQP